MAYRAVINDAGIIETQPLNPGEKFAGSENSTLSDRTMSDYWQWAFSDIVGNTERGILAEYLVAMAVGSEKPKRGSWYPYDIEAPDGTKIEVKSASYVQSWYQKKLSKIQFGIRKTKEWTPETNDFGTEKKRQSDVYVFCLLSQQVKADINPLDLEQWEFYVVPTSVLDRELGDIQNISLSRVKQYSHRLTFSQIAKAIGIK
ncbi:hypothetical protein M1N56_06445 [Dehalococcoidia bacterium]|nr:hypothetical protein [Dehalococcoidia bacterium]